MGNGRIIQILSVLNIMLNFSVLVYMQRDPSAYTAANYTYFHFSYSLPALGQLDSTPFSITH